MKTRNCIVLAAALLLGVSALARAQAPAKPLSNADIIEMTHKGMSVDAITKIPRSFSVQCFSSSP